MAFNPLLNTPVGDNSHTQPSKAVNKDKPRSQVNTSVLDLSRANFKSERFGTYNPFEVIDVTARDIVPLHNSHNVRTLPMKSPMLNPLQLHKDYFFVPMDAILPRTWEYIFKQPSQGDDVPNDAHCLFDFSVVYSFYSRIASVISLETNTSLNTADFFRILSLEFFLSRGSLLNSLGKVFHGDFDSILDGLLNAVDFGIQFRFGSATSSAFGFSSRSVSSGSYQVVSKSVILDMIRTYPERVVSFSFVSPSGSLSNSSTDALTYLRSSRWTDLGLAVNLFRSVPDAIDGLENAFDVRRVYAYQIACAEFYTRGNIDSIYCAQLWRDNAFSLYKRLSGSLIPSFITVNGTLLEYDVLSYHYTHSACSSISSNSSNSTFQIALNAYLFFQYLFGYRNSLIFGDYFVDSRTQPLATNTEHALPETDITVFDINDSLVYQRYGNKVVKQGNDFNEYLDKIFNSRPTPDFHFPKYIRGYDCAISGDEVAVTSETGTGTLVQNIVSGESSELVEVAIERPGVILGISYFDVPPLYMNYQERFFLHQDRYDDYIPDLQYLGDQKVYAEELNRIVSTTGLTFGYNSRYAEYKQRFGVVGGAVGTPLLPSWCLVLDNDENPFRNHLLELSNMFVRFMASDFDVMFETLSGLSLASSFHFIVMYNNQAVTSRNMLVNPNTLL